MLLTGGPAARVRDRRGRTARRLTLRVHGAGLRKLRVYNGLQIAGFGRKRILFRTGLDDSAIGVMLPIDDSEAWVLPGPRDELREAACLPLFHFAEGERCASELASL